MLIHACGDDFHARSDPRASRSRAVAWGLWGIHTGERVKGRCRGSQGHGEVSADAVSFSYK